MIRAVDVDDWYRDALDAALTSCEDCRHTGNIVEMSDDDPFEYQVRPCACKAAVQKQAALIWANVPVEFWRAEEAGLDWNKGHYEKVRQYASNLKAHRSDGSGLLMVGENGVGKTFSACHIITQALAQGYSAGYLTMNEWMVNRRSWDDKRTKEWMDQILSADFLAIDEVGKEYKAKGSDWVHSEFDMLLRRRRGYLMPTIIISNLTVVQFKERYGASLFSILRDRMDVMQYQPGDYREVLGKRRRR